MYKSTDDLLHHLMYRASMYQKMADVEVPTQILTSQSAMLDATTLELCKSLLSAIKRVHDDEVQCISTQPPCSYCGRHKMENEDDEDALDVEFTCTAGRSLSEEARQDYGLHGCPDFTAEGAYFDVGTPMRELQELHARNTPVNQYRMLGLIGARIQQQALTALTGVSS